MFKLIMLVSVQSVHISCAPERETRQIDRDRDNRDGERDGDGEGERERYE